jgi:hypothetical protein
MALGLRWSFYEKTTSALRGDFFFLEFDLVMTLWKYKEYKYLSLDFLGFLKAFIHPFNNRVVMGGVIIL